MTSFAGANDISWVRFGKDEAKLEVRQPHLARQASTGRSGVAAIGVAREFQRVWTAAEGKTSTGTPRWSFCKTGRRVTCYYFCLWDAGSGPAFIKVCAYFPYPAKIWLNGHEWVKRQAGKAGLGFTALSNGFAACGNPAVLQVICDRLQPGTIEVFAQRWLHRLPLPFGPADQRAGYWWEISMRQVEVSRTIVFDAPRHARGFFEALAADNLGIGRPHNVEIIFGRRPAAAPGELPAPRSTGATTAASWSTCSASTPGRACQGTILASPAFERIAHPSVDAEGRRTPALRFGDPRVMALAGALCQTLPAATGFTSKNPRVLIAGLLGSAYTPGQMTYDLRRLRLNGVIRRLPPHQPLHAHRRGHPHRRLLHQHLRPAPGPRSPPRTSPRHHRNSVPRQRPSPAMSTTTPTAHAFLAHLET